MLTGVGFFAHARNSQQEAALPCASQNVSSAERLDAVVLSIARLIGRRIAREDFEKATRAANDNDAPSEEERT